MTPRPHHSTRHPGIRRAVRRFSLGSGPLKRGSDRVQVAARVVFVLLVFAAPAFAVWAATATSNSLQAVASSEAAARRPARALLLETAVQQSDPSDGRALSVPTTGRWTAPDMTVHEGTVLVPPGTLAGTTVHVWVARDGTLTTAPLDPRSVQGSATAMGALTLLGIPVLAWTLYAGLSAALDAQRERRWAQGWAAVEPVWATRLR